MSEEKTKEENEEWEPEKKKNFLSKLEKAVDKILEVAEQKGETTPVIPVPPESPEEKEKEPKQKGKGFLDWLL